MSENDGTRTTGRKLRPAPGEPRVSDKIRATTGEDREALIERLPWETGYAKPPVETRFAPGKSGNPKGRPKGTKNVATIVRTIADEPVEYTSRGKKRRAPAKEVILRRQQLNALAGDRKAAEFIIDLMRDEERAGNAVSYPGVTEAFTIASQQMIDVFMAVAAGEPLEAVREKVGE